MSGGYYYKKPENKLDNLLMARRNLFLRLPEGDYVLISATKLFVTVHYFERSFRGDPVSLQRFDMPPGLFDGQGWDLRLLVPLLIE